jgi:hypothetical protein
MYMDAWSKCILIMYPSDEEVVIDYQVPMFYKLQSCLALRSHLWQFLGATLVLT